MEHFTAIKVIEKLAPEINTSQDPKGTLIKFATENNLSPAELERLGQVFNSAKTLSHLEKSANRGDSYDLLDVEDLVESFSSHTVPTLVEKSANVKIRSGGALPNFFQLETMEKKAGATELHPVAESILRNQRAQKEQELVEFTADIPATIHELKTEVVKVANDIVRDIYLANKDATQVFLKLAEDSQASPDGNRDAIELLCKKAFTYFGEVKLDMEKLASRKVVTDTTGLLDKVEEMQDMINVMYDLNQMLKSAEDDVSAPGKREFIRPKQKSERSELEEIAEAQALVHPDNEEDIQNAPVQADTSEQEPTPRNPITYTTPPTRRAETYSQTPDSVIEYILRKNPQDPQTPQESPPNLTALNNIKGFIDRLHEDKITKLYKVEPTSRGYVNAGVDKMMASVETAATIQELMQDPVISAHTPSTVVSIYNSLAQVNPSMMRDKNVAKFALREALQYEGVTPHTYGQLVDIDKGKSDIAKNEILSRKELYGKV